MAGIITAGRIATPVVASGFSGISGGDVGIATFPPGFFDPTGPGLTPAVNYYVNYSEIVSTGATTDSQFDDEIGQAVIGVTTPGGAGIGRTGPVGSAVTDARFSITPEFGLGVMGFLIDEPGGGYLRKQMVLSVVVVEQGCDRTNQIKKQMVHIYSQWILVL